MSLLYDIQTAKTHLVFPINLELVFNFSNLVVLNIDSKKSPFIIHDDLDKNYLI